MYVLSDKMETQKIPKAQPEEKPLENYMKIVELIQLCVNENGTRNIRCRKCKRIDKDLKTLWNTRTLKKKQLKRKDTEQNSTIAMIQLSQKNSKKSKFEPEDKLNPESHHQ